MRTVEGVAEVDDVDAFVERIDAIGTEHDCAVQVFDADLVTGRAHLRSAAAHANRAFERDENVADDRAVEILLYAAGRRQIREALAMGVSEGETPAVAVVDDGTTRPDGADGAPPSGEAGDEPAAAAAVRELLVPADTFGPSEERLADFFDVSERERRATEASLAALVRERVALLDVEK